MFNNLIINESSRNKVKAKQSKNDITNTMDNNENLQCRLQQAAAAAKPNTATIMSTKTNSFSHHCRFGLLCILLFYSDDSKPGSIASRFHIMSVQAMHVMHYTSLSINNSMLVFVLCQRPETPANNSCLQTTNETL